MKDEINEIFDYLKESAIKENLYFEINPEKAKILYDYITNLEQENEELKLELLGYRKAILRDDKLLGLKSRIDKAIEYIKSHKPSDIGICGNSKKYYYTLNEDSVDNLLNILGGDEE